jgi:hypothetical protein
MGLLRRDAIRVEEIGLAQLECAGSPSGIALQYMLDGVGTHGMRVVDGTRSFGVFMQIQWTAPIKRAVVPL